MTAATVCSFCLDPARLKCGRCGEPFCAARCFGQSAHAATCGGAGAVGMPRGGGEGRSAARDSPGNSSPKSDRWTNRGTKRSWVVKMAR